VRFFRVENNGSFKEVLPAKQTGFGEILNTPFCSDDLFGDLFYDCGKYN
jgi:hypothetical protein